MSFNRILKGLMEIQNTSGRLDKEKIFNEILLDEDERFKEVLNYTFNPFWNYRITLEDRENNIQENWRIPKLDSSKSNKLWNDFRLILDKMRHGEITGGRARKAVESFIDESSPTYAFWLTRILNRDLKIGLAEKTIAKHIPGLLPKTSPMLCEVFDVKDLEAKADSLIGWLIEPKLDGLRAYIAVERGKARVFSRSGKPLYNVAHIIEQVEALGIDNAVFDGELAGPNFKSSISPLKSQKKHGAASDLKYWIFDVVPLSHWKDQKSDIPLWQRKLALKAVTKVEPSKRPNLRIVVPIEIKNKAHLIDVLETHLDEGLEGSVFKDPKSVYIWKRSMAWMKIKPYYECDLRIVDIEEGQGTRKGRCGALVVEGVIKWKGQTYHIRTEVGAGLSEKQTIQFWNDFHSGKLVGRWCEVRFGEVSDWDVKKKVHALKFGRLRRMRPDKD